MFPWVTYLNNHFICVFPVLVAYLPGFLNGTKYIVPILLPKALTLSCRVACNKLCVLRSDVVTACIFSIVSRFLSASIEETC